jgi:hypothetical protein
MENIKKLKIVLVIALSTILEQGSEFVRQLNLFVKQFSNVEHLKGSIALVISKVDSKKTHE